MAEWVTLQNIERFQKALSQETDPEKRRILEELLGKEQAKAARADETC